MLSMMMGSRRIDSNMTVDTSDFEIMYSCWEWDVPFLKVKDVWIEWTFFKKMLEVKINWHSRYCWNKAWMLLELRQWSFCWPVPHVSDKIRFTFFLGQTNVLICLTDFQISGVLCWHFKYLNCCTFVFSMISIRYPYHICVFYVLCVHVRMCMFGYISCLFKSCKKSESFVYCKRFIIFICYYFC